MKQAILFDGLLTIAAVCGILANPLAHACTRVLWNSNGKVVVTARTMEWSQDPDTIWVELKNLDFDKNQAVTVLNSRNPNLAGEVSRAFEPVK